MRVKFGYLWVALMGVLLLVLGGIGGYASGKASRSCDVTVKGERVRCDTLAITSDLNIESLERANVEIAHGNTVMRAMYEDLRATKVALADANAVVDADARAIDTLNGNEALLPYALGRASQALQTATAASKAMHLADRAYAAAVKTNPLTIGQ